MISTRRHVVLLNTYGCTETTMITHAVQLIGPGTDPELASDAEAPTRAAAAACARSRRPMTVNCWCPVPLWPPDTSGRPTSRRPHSRSPITDQDRTRWFRTGDLVIRGDGKGLLYSRGRADEQVKVLGVRVHPAEVEAQLNTHPAVAGAVVVGERLLGRTALTAYVVRPRGVTSGRAEDVTYVSAYPVQFVPSRVKFVAALAYTASGKVDRAATRRAAVDYDDKGAVR